MIRANILRLNCFKVERRTAFFGEDIFFLVPPGNVSEVVFKPRTNNSAEVVLLQAGKVVSPRCHISSLGHLVLEDAKEEDEGLYIFRNISGPNTPKHIVLAVKGELSVCILQLQVVVVVVQLYRPGSVEERQQDFCVFSGDK